MDAQRELSQELIGEFVQAAHFDPNKVRELHQQYPVLLNARWDKYDETALEAAAHMGQREIANYLLAAGAPLNICAAAMLGMTEQVAEFLQVDPSLRNAKGAHGITLIYHAALSGETAIPELLVGYGNVEDMDAALHGAVRFNHTDMVAWLLANGVSNVEVKNFADKTPLQIAVENNNQEIAGLLRQHGAQAPNLMNSRNS